MTTAYHKARRAWIGRILGLTVSLCLFGTYAVGAPAGPDEAAAAEEGSGAEHTQLEEALTGRWLTEGAKAIVEITRCADDDGAFCGVITWTWKTPTHVGRQVLAGFSFDGQHWKGRLFDPARMNGYRGRLELKGPDHLEVKGCLLVICRTQTWLRPKALMEAMH